MRKLLGAAFGVALLSLVTATGALAAAGKPGAFRADNLTSPL